MNPEKVTILIIEDNPADARLIKEALDETIGVVFELKYAEMLSDGLKKISKNTFDIILLDLGLPDSSGLETITIVNKKNMDIPLIVFTGTADLDVAKKALSIGAQDYLVKGQFDGSSLSRSIRYAIERKKIEVELKKSENKYWSLFEYSIDGIYITTPQGKYIDVNTALVNMLGYSSKEELMSIDIKKELYVSEDERPGPNKRNKIFEAKFKKKDGSVINAEISSEVIFENAKPKYYQGIVRDVSNRKQAEAEIKDNLSKLKKTFEQTIATLGNIIEVKDPYTSGHQKKVAAISMAIAKNLGLSKESVEAISTASLIHDIGKISIPQSILSKPGKLTDIERAMIEIHPVTGYDIVKEIDFPQPIAKIILQHHEKLNGSGYPSGLKGDDIMLEARIITVADVFDAMTSHRPYRAAFSLKVTMDELINNKGILYDPAVIDCLSNYVDSYYKIEAGDNLCSIYDDFEGQISYIVPYMDIGLKKNHKCIYITDENSIESIIDAFRIKGTGLSEYIEKGQFVFFTSNDTYLKDGYFDPDRMISLLKAMEKTALKEGFAGIRVTGEMTWVLSKLPGTERFMEYENKLDEFLPGSKATAICQYNESKFGSKILNEVIKAHSKVGINGLFYNNKFYKKLFAVSSNNESDNMDYKDIERKYCPLIEKIKK